MGRASAARKLISGSYTAALEAIALEVSAKNVLMSGCDLILYADEICKHEREFDDVDPLFSSH